MTELLLGLVLLAAMAIPAVASAGHATSRVRFLAPKAGATTKSKITFTVELRNFTIDAKDVGAIKKPKMGHLHFSMDDGKYDHPRYSGANGQLALMLGTAGKYSPAVKPTITYANLPKGKHTLVVVLAHNDHSLAGPQASVTFTVN